MALFAPAAVASCASGSDTQASVGGGGMGGASAASNGAGMPTSTGTGTSTGTDPSTGSGSNGASGTSTTGSGGTMCVPHCTSDQECHTSCPSAGSSLNCCDISTGVCYVTGSSTCPAPKPDAGMMMPPY